MAMFLGHIAFLLATFGVANGLVLLQLGQENKRLFSLGGWMLVIVGILGWICIGYYMWHYYSIGNYDSAYPQMSKMMIPGKMS